MQSLPEESAAIEIEGQATNGHPYDVYPVPASGSGRRGP